MPQSPKDPIRVISRVIGASINASVVILFNLRNVCGIQASIY